MSGTGGSRGAYLQGPWRSSCAACGRGTNAVLWRGLRAARTQSGDLAPPGPHPSPFPALAVLGKSSRRLLAYTVQRKWVAATRTLLAAVAADQAPSEAMAAVSGLGVGGALVAVTMWAEHNARVARQAHAGMAAGGARPLQAIMQAVMQLPVLAAHRRHVPCISEKRKLSTQTF